LIPQGSPNCPNSEARHAGWAEWGVSTHYLSPLMYIVTPPSPPKFVRAEISTGGTQNVTNQPFRVRVLVGALHGWGVKTNPPKVIRVQRTHFN
jgi:hypothetical protein